MKAVLIYVLCTTNPQYSFNGELMKYNTNCMATVGKNYESMAACKKEEIKTTRDIDFENQTVKVRQIKTPQVCVEIGEREISSKKFKMVEIK